MGHWWGKLLVGQHWFPIEAQGWGVGGGSTDRSEDNPFGCQPILESGPPPDGVAQSGLR
jgi:hypothetical protein